MRRIPSAFTGAFSDPVLIASGVWNLSSSIRPWPSGVRIIGTAERKAAVLSFAVEGVHPHDVGTLLNEEGVAIRTGHHCAQPVMQRYDVPATTRASFSVYSDLDDVDRLTDAIRAAQRVFGTA